MTPEQLMMPRYEVINNWPDNSKYKVGDIIEVSKVEWKGNYEEWLDTFPHLFNKLNWWEKRKIGDMPLYVKWSEASSTKIEMVVAWDNYTRLQCRTFDKDANDYRWDNPQESGLVPATEKEYLSNNKLK